MLTKAQEEEEVEAESFSFQLFSKIFFQVLSLIFFLPLASLLLLPFFFSPNTLLFVLRFFFFLNFSLFSSSSGELRILVNNNAEKLSDLHADISAFYFVIQVTKIKSFQIYDS